MRSLCLRSLRGVEYEVNRKNQTNNSTEKRNWHWWITGSITGLKQVNHILFYLLYFIGTSLVFLYMIVFFGQQMNKYFF